MTTEAAKAFASKLNGRQYRAEITGAEAREARELGLLVVFGASDDLTEFAGALADEVGAFDGAVHDIVRAPHGLVIATQSGRETERLLASGWRPPEPIFSVKAEWAPKDLDCSWRITPTVSFAPFDIMEDDELYCRGAVVDLRDLGLTP